MIASLALEVFTPGPRNPVKMFGSAPWVKRIKGLSAQGKIMYEFVSGDTDYSRANSVGSRGVYKHYILQSGNLYEVCSRTSWKRIEQYFCMVQDGKIVKLTRQEVLNRIAHTATAAVPAVHRRFGDG